MTRAVVRHGTAAALLTRAALLHPPASLGAQALFLTARPLLILRSVRLRERYAAQQSRAHHRTDHSIRLHTCSPFV
jgi:hypothetical protein